MLKKRQIKQHSESKDVENLSDISDISCPEQPEFQSIKSKKPKKRRHKFTHSQDKKMLEYIMNESRYGEIKGVALWKDMELLQITDHSRQSMRCRFLKTLIPNLHQYDVPKKWVDTLKWLFPAVLQKHPDKENAKTDFPACSMLEKCKRQSPRLQSSPRQAANGEHKTAKESDLSEDEKSIGKRAEKKGEANKGDNSCESTEPFVESPICHRRGKKRLCKQSLQFVSSSKLDTEEKKVPLSESLITPRRGKKRLAKQSLLFDSSSESDTEEEKVPLTESPIIPRRGKKRLAKQSLQFDSSSESDTMEEKEKNVSTASSMCADPSLSKSAQDASKDDGSGEQSDLSDYDQYLLGIAKKNKSSSKKSPRSDANVLSQSDNANTTNKECVPDSEEEMDQDVVKDRRSRLQHRRHQKKTKKALSDNSTLTTPSPKKGKKPDLAEFVTNTHPEEILFENGDEESCSPEKDCDELSEYETIISDISKSYGLTNREVLSTIISFNGSIEKSITYIRLGPELSQLKPWIKEEDEIISSTDEANIKTIATKRGNKFIAERLQFLENFSEDFIS